MHFATAFTHLAFAIFAVNSQSYFSCKNEQNQPVDWYIIYKIPRFEESSDVLISKGFAYLYMDASTNGQWVRSNISIQEERHSVGYTLKQLYEHKNDSGAFYMMYNDEWPNGNVSFNKGHTKGTILFDTISGFWLIHSVPKFPAQNAYGYPLTGGRYGQAFICVTFAYSALADIGRQLYLNEPFIFDTFLPKDIGDKIDILHDVIKGKSPSQAPYYRQVQLKSLGGLQLTSFAKHGLWDKDLYVDLVASSFQRTFYAETWQNGHGNIGSNCTAAYKVYNIADLKLQNDIIFNITKDHSKWAVSVPATPSRNRIKVPKKEALNYICIGDVNRQITQFKRGGGTMCLSVASVWKTFKDSVVNVEPCKRASRRP